jgi:hypothetical protein
MSANCFKKNGFLPAMPAKAKDYSEVIAGATCPRSPQFSFELMGPQRWVKGIIFKLNQGMAYILGCLGKFLQDPFCRTNK